MHAFSSRSMAAAFLSLFIIIISGHGTQNFLADAVDTSTLEGKFLFWVSRLFPTARTRQWPLDDQRVRAWAKHPKGWLNFIFLILDTELAMLPVSCQVWPNLLTFDSSIRHVPRSGTISSGMPLFHQLYSTRRIERLPFWIQLYRYNRHSLPMDAREQHQRYPYTELLRRVH